MIESETKSPGWRWQGTTLGCLICGDPEICCAEATYDDGSYDDAYCRAHCGPHPRRADAAAHDEYHGRYPDRFDCGDPACLSEPDGIGWDADPPCSADDPCASFPECRHGAGGTF
jgi:hypothetical protein